MRKIILILISLLILRIEVYGLRSSSASIIATGGAGIGDSINSKALQYNVGSLGFLKYYQIELSHLPWLFSTSYDQINFVTPFLRGGMGVSVQFFHSFFNPDNFNYIYGQRQDSLQDYDLTGSIGYGVPIMKNMGLGAGINYGVSSFLGETDKVLSFNLGVLYRMSLLANLFRVKSTTGSLRSRDNFRVGLAVNNIGSSYGQRVSVGLAFIPIPYLKLLIDGDYSIYRYYDNQFDLMTGAEFSMRFGFTRFFLRAGYSTVVNEINIGAGFQINFGEKFYRLDYAQGLGGDLNDDFGTRVGAFSITVGESELK